MAKSTEIYDFITSRFPKESHWMDGNCYYFAVILQTRFGGKIFYDVIHGHFVTEIDGVNYDWSGKYEYDNDCVLIPWEDFQQYDEVQYQRIVDCCIK